MVRIGFLGEMSWLLVQRIAETTKELVEPLYQETDNHSLVKQVELEEELLIEPESDENSTDYLPPEYISMADRKDPILVLLADEDVI